MAVTTQHLGRMGEGFEGTVKAGEKTQQCWAGGGMYLKVSILFEMMTR